MGDAAEDEIASGERQWFLEEIARREPQPEATFDRDGYPTDETLDRIRNWYIGTNADFEAAMDFVGAAWSYPHMWQKERGWIDSDDPRHPYLRYVFSTGGWSGNESLVTAMEENLMLGVGAWSWRRGGHYEYRFPMDPVKEQP